MACRHGAACLGWWRYQAGGDVHSSPAVSPGGDATVYAGSNDKYLHAISCDPSRFLVIPLDLL